MRTKNEAIRVMHCQNSRGGWRKVILVNGRTPTDQDVIEHVYSTTHPTLLSARMEVSSTAEFHRRAKADEACQ